MNPSSLSRLFQEELYQYNTPVMVVLSKPWDAYSADEKLLLQKILTSVKINLDAIQMISLPSLALKSLVPFSPASVLLFGSDTEEEIPLYQQTPAQGFMVVRADDLPHLDEGRKKNLWIALREMFRV